MQKQKNNTTRSLTEAFKVLRTRLELNAYFQKQISTNYQTVKKLVDGKGFNVQLIGSLQRMTRISPLSDDQFDIDILVVLGEFQAMSYSGGITTADAMSLIYEKITDHKTYDALQPEIDNPVVGFEYKNKVKVELVPAFRDSVNLPFGQGFYIPGRNGEWVIADYNHDRDYIVDQNKNSEGFLIPIIKILKCIKNKHFSFMNSYCLEILAAKLIPEIVLSRRNHNLACSDQELIAWFFYLAKIAIFKPILVPDSKDLSVNQSLNSNEKQVLSIIFAELSRNCFAALEDSSDSFEKWQKIIGSRFPKFGGVYE